MTLTTHRLRGSNMNNVKLNHSTPEDELNITVSFFT